MHQSLETPAFNQRGIFLKFLNFQFDVTSFHEPAITYIHLFLVLQSKRRKDSILDLKPPREMLIDA